MRRTMQTVAIPVFQFGIFSDNDLSFFAGPDFNFGGRVHTNQNLYLAQGDGTTLLMSDRVTAVGEIVRSHLSNGENTQTTTNGTAIRVPCASPARRTARPPVANCRDLAVAEDSVVITSNPPVPPSLLTWVPAWAPRRAVGDAARRRQHRGAEWDGLSRGPTTAGCATAIPARAASTCRSSTSPPARTPDRFDPPAAGR